MNLLEYGQYKETKVHEQPGFSYNTYLCTIPQDFEKVNLHWHSQMELIYVKKGSGLITVDLVPFHSPAGSIVLVHPGQLHAIEHEDCPRMEYENIIFSLSMLESREMDWCSQRFYEPLSSGKMHLPSILLPGAPYYAAAAACINAADAACEKKEAGYPLTVKAELQLFFSILYPYRTGLADMPAAKNTEKIKNILNYIQNHYPEKITIRDAAFQAGYSSSHFMRFFKEYAGQTFVEYLLDYRLTAAARLLSETNEPVSAIAPECGFENLSYFCRCFRKKYGIQPSGMRKT